MNKNIWFKVLIILVVLGFVLFICSLVVNLYIKNSTKNQIYSIDEIDDDFDCILVLGAGIRNDGTPSPMLEDRLKTAFEVYSRMNIPIIVSGDHGQSEYDEVNVMKKYLVELGVPSEKIFMDHAGFSTYESIYRAIEIFDVKKAIIITQEYHLYRSLYISKKLGLEAIGVSANLQEYSGQSVRDFREYLARNKDFITAIFKPKPTYLGESIPVTGDGNITNDS